MNATLTEPETEARTASANAFILYTYQTVNGQLVCHAYGDYTSPQQADADGENLKAHALANSEPALGYMVLPKEAPPGR